VPAVLLRETAVVDHERRALVPNTSILLEHGHVVWIRPTDDEGVLPDGTEVVDASGTTALPGMVDAHCHVTLPGGAHWLSHVRDTAAQLRSYADDNARLLRQAGVRWARDVGSPVVDGRAVSLDVRDAWRGRPDHPYIRAAGAWLARTGSCPGAVEVDDADGLFRAATGQLDAGADLVKIYLDGPDRVTAPFTADEVRRVVESAHARGARVTAHSGYLDGARVGVAAGVNALEHGFQLDADVAAHMARQGTALVSTLAVLESWGTFATTTKQDRFATAEGRQRIGERREAARESVRLAHRAGVIVAAGTDAGGGSLRANQLAWEVQALVAAGLEPYDALLAATVNGGRVLGEPEAGQLREGGSGDVVLIHGDPLSDPAALWRVWRTTW
jgi:imidazolonepropionase-like amidohydrolase